MNHNTACVRCVRVSLFSIFLHERTFSSTVSGSGGGQAGRIEGSRTILSATKTSSSPHLLTIINTKSKRTRQFPAIRCPHCAHLHRSHHPPRHFMCPQRWCRRRGCSSSCSSSSSAIVSPKSRTPHPNPHHSSWSDGVMDRFCFKVKRRTRFERSKKRSSPPTR
jgi:hypothetical protein